MWKAGNLGVVLLPIRSLLVDDYTSIRKPSCGRTLAPKRTSKPIRPRTPCRWKYPSLPTALPLTRMVSAPAYFSRRETHSKKVPIAEFRLSIFKSTCFFAGQRRVAASSFRDGNGLGRFRLPSKLALIGFVFPPPHRPQYGHNFLSNKNLRWFDRQQIGFVFSNLLGKTCYQNCHSALDAESKTVNKPGFLFSQEWQNQDAIRITQYPIRNKLALFFRRLKARISPYTPFL